MARILIIEDEIDLASLYRMALEKRSHTIVGIFDHPREPITLATEPGSRFVADLVLLDERLSGASGTAFLPELRSAFSGAAIIVATADPEAGARALELGADAVAKKPFSIRKLMTDIDEILERR